MPQSLLAFAESVKLSGCRVINTNSPNLIFLCGGPHQNPRASGPYQSIRDYFSCYVTTNRPEIADRVRLAETISRWFDRETFSDLLEVEEHLAGLADVIILFVESPGSIAELGAFSALSSVNSKLLAIANTAFSEPSFISDGPLRRLLDPNQGSVLKYRWESATELLNVGTNIDVFDELSQEICELLQNREKTRHKEQKLDIGTHGHAMLMVADLIDIACVASITDLHECLNALGKNALPRRRFERSTVQKYLFLLKHLEIIQEEYISQYLYVTRGRGPYIAYDFEPGAAVDRISAKIQIRNTFKGTRARILNRFRHGPEPQGNVSEVDDV